MKVMTKNCKSNGNKPIFFSFSILPLMVGGIMFLSEIDNANQIDTNDISLLYKLDFSNSDNLGKNVASTDFADATTISGNTLSQIDGAKGNKGVSFPGKTKEVNYLSLPTKIFENQNTITISGWFYQPEDVGTYLGEFGIYSDDTRATFRAEPYANYHGDSYLYMVGDCENEKSQIFNAGVKPVYSAWYHMTYEFDGINHLFNVYQNGKLAISKETPDTFSPKDFYSENSHFYLGQSAFMGTSRTENKDDYQGMMSDIRIYSGLLTESEIKDEYSLSILDFKYDEYTFDSTESIYKDNIRDYDLKENNKTPYVDDGSLRVKDGSAVYFYDKSTSHNNRMFSGFNTMTVSMDMKIYSEDNWKRALDFYIDGTNRITEMYSCPGISQNVLKLCYNYKDTGDNWIMDGNGQDISHLNTNQWYNITIVFNNKTLDFYMDGDLKSSTTLPENVASYSTFFYDFVNAENGNATLGKNTYESGNYADASFDNVRFYGTACSKEEIKKAIDGDIKNTVTIHSNTEENETKTYKLSADESMTLSSDLFSRDGYSLTGYNTKSDGTGKNYEIGTELTISEDTELYAIWEINCNLIHFVAEEGSTGEMTDITVNYGTEATLPECGFSKVGYAFKEYNTSEDGAGTAYHVGDKLSLDKETTLYIIFEAKTFNVHFSANGGEGSHDSLSVTYDTETLIPEVTFTRKGYNHIGYSLTPEGMVTLRTGDRVDNISAGEDITLYAVYEKKTLSITYDANGGTGAMDTDKVESLTLVYLKKNTFAKSGFHFIGWCTTKDGKVEYTDEAEVELIDDDLTLYAIWEKDQETPSTSDNMTGSEKTDTTDNTSDNGNKKKGCFGSIATTSSLMVAGIFGITALLIKKKKEDK